MRGGRDQGNALLKNICPLHIYAVTSLLKEAGCDIKIYDDAVSIECDKLKSVPLVRTMPYPGFPTDEQAPFMALMSIASGNTLFIETIFENRFKHVGELLRMGAKITTEGRVSLVEGGKKTSFCYRSGDRPSRRRRFGRSGPRRGRLYGDFFRRTYISRL